MTTWEVVSYTLVLASGFLAGFINTLSGGGSAFSLAALENLGMSLDGANGTNRVAILLQNVVGVQSFAKQGYVNHRDSLRCALPALLGALPGAYVATILDAQQLKWAVGVMMLVMLGLLVLQPNRWLVDKDPSAAPKGLWSWLFLLACGFYAGFIQMGIGVFLLCVLVLASGMDLIRANAMKLYIVLILVGPVLLVFAWQGLVNWPVGLLLACGNMLGAKVASKQAAKRGTRFVRALLMVVVGLSAVKYLFF